MMESGPEEQKAILKPMGEFDVQLFNEKRFTFENQAITDVTHIMNFVCE